MSQQVSISVTGQALPVPTRQERDEAYSFGGGRKAKECTKPIVAPSAKHSSKHQSADQLEAPVGLDLETRGDDEPGSSHCHNA